jgi:hypothetical protein
MGPRLIYDPGDNHGLPSLAAGELCKWDAAIGAHVLGDALVVVERPMLTPDFAGDRRNATIGSDIPLGNWDHKSVGIHFLDSSGENKWKSSGAK